MIHVNDSKTNLGSHADRHAGIGEGKLGLEIFHAILRDRRFLEIPKILEIPESDKRSKDNLRLLRKLQLIPGRLPKVSKLQKQVIRKKTHVN